MSISTSDFWKLVAESRLLTAEQCQKLQADFGQIKGAGAQTSAKTLAEWLVSRQALSRYQSTVLLAGRAGPFYYGDYRVYDRLDHGPLAGQFRAVHAPTGHPVMLRFLAGSVLKDHQQWALIAARVKQQAGLVSPLLQRYFEPVDLTAFRLIAAEDLRGEPLDEVLAKHGRMPPAEAARIIRQAAFALASLHQLKLAHGDVRPAQFLLDARGDVKLLVDPAKLPGPVNVSQLDPNSPAAAIADYLAPEFLQVNKSPDALTDIYALGCVAYQLLTGQVPFPGGLPGQKLARHAAEPIQQLEPFGVPHPLAKLVAFMMAKNAAVRTQTAALVAEQLTPFVEPTRLQVPVLAPPPTLAAYENWIKQKQAVLSTAEKVKASAPAGPVIDLNRGSATPVAASGGASPSPALTTGALPGKRAAGKSKRQDKTMLIGGGVALALAAITIVVIAANMGGDDPKKVAKKPEKNVSTTNVSTDPVVPPVKDDKKQTTRPPLTNPGQEKPPIDKPPVDNPPVETPVAKYDVQPDDGQALWASPTAGAPITLTNVPANAQIFLVVRPKELAASPHGQKVLQALGPTFAAHRQAWEMGTGIKFEEAVQVMMALHDNAGKLPRPSYRVELAAPVAAADLLKRWGDPAPQEIDGTKYYVNQGRAYYIASGTVFVMGDPLDIKELAAAKGSPPVLRREVDQLRRLSDNDRHFTLLFAPNYLHSDGRELFTGPYEKLLNPIAWFLGDEVKATMASLHCGEPFYAEARVISEIGLEKHKLAGDLRDRLAQIPGHIENYITALDPPQYWKKIAGRYPSMIFYLHSQTRVGVEDDVAIVNAVAPGALAHNLVIGGELALLSTPGQMVAAGPTTPMKTVPQTLEELLKHKLTFEQVRNDMNLTMAELEKEIASDVPGLPFPFAIKIIGKDLEGDGITRNQPIADFKMENAPLAEVLDGLVKKGNGNPADPASDEQKLVWVVGPDPDKPDQQVVLITTRKAAVAKKYNLRPPFVK